MKGQMSRGCVRLFVSLPLRVTIRGLARDQGKKNLLPGGDLFLSQTNVRFRVWREATVGSRPGRRGRTVARLPATPAHVDPPKSTSLQS